ncbi:MAG: HlyD family secretion protein [Pirellulaceae bacterium]
MRGFSAAPPQAVEQPGGEARPAAAPLRADAPAASSHASLNEFIRPEIGRQAHTGGPSPAVAFPALLGRPRRLPGIPARPTPLPKRPKGRLFMGVLLLSLCAGGCYTAWHALFRYEAFGAISGRVIRVPATHGGNVQAIHFREGEYVEQGRLLVTLENVELNQQLARLGDELRMAQANLDAEISRLNWQAQQQGDRSQRAAADYLELCGELVQEQARLDELLARFERESTLFETGAISQNQLDETRYALQGQQAKVAKRGEGLQERKKLAEASHIEPPTEQLKPLFVKIEVLQSEIARMRDLVKQGQIRAPVKGRVIRSLYFTGERVDPSAVVIEILEEGSLEAVLYFQQQDVRRISVGQTLWLQMPTVSGSVRGTVTRLEEQYHDAPASLERRYCPGETVLPVHVHLHMDPPALQELHLGSEVWLPRRWPWQEVDTPLTTRPETEVSRPPRSQSSTTALPAETVDSPTVNSEDEHETSTD